MLRVLLSLLVAGASLVACTTTTAPPTNCWIGLRGQYLLDAREGHDRSEVALTDAVRIISARLNAMGLAAFDVRTLPDFRIDVDLPPLANTDEIREVIVATGIIEFVPVPAEESVSEGDPRPDESDPLFGQEAIATAQRVTSVDGLTRSRLRSNRKQRHCFRTGRATTLAINWPSLWMGSSCRRHSSAVRSTAHSN